MRKVRPQTRRRLSAGSRATVHLGATLSSTHLALSRSASGVCVNSNAKIAKGADEGGV